MKLIIDIPEENYNQIISSYQGSNVRPKDYEIAIINGTPIPDNATNGDVIMAVFEPNINKRHNGEDIEAYYFDTVWWNAPYKRSWK